MVGYLPGSNTVPIPTKEAPNATILSLWRRLLDSPRYAYAIPDGPEVLQINNKTITC